MSLNRAIVSVGRALVGVCRRLSAQEAGKGGHLQREACRLFAVHDRRAKSGKRYSLALTPLVLDGSISPAR